MIYSILQNEIDFSASFTVCWTAWE